MAQTFNGKPGDLIEINRGDYQHWAVYTGENKVVHFGTDDTGGQSSGPLDYLISRNGYVLHQKFADVVGNDHYQVNNLLDKKYDARDPSVIVKEACAMVGHKLPYNVATYNCEHFATKMRYGKAESRQVKNKSLIAGTILSGGSSAALVTGSPVVAAGLAAGVAFALSKGLFSSSSRSSS